VNETPVASLVSATCAPGMMAPVGSVTVPTTREVVPWAKAVPQAQRNSNVETTPIFLIPRKNIRKGRRGKDRFESRLRTALWIAEPLSYDD
jgi:hypothetical protein